MNIDVEILYSRASDRYTLLDLKTLYHRPFKYEGAYSMKQAFGGSIQKSFKDRDEVNQYIESLKVSKASSGPMTKIKI